jgi:hypothetical protein
VTRYIGADQTSRRSAAGVGVSADPDGTLTVDGFECPDIAKHGPAHTLGHISPP